jgi:hypothetical protein
MNKTLVMLVLVLVLSLGSCSVIPAQQPEPLVLPYPLYEQEVEGSQVTVTLDSACTLQPAPDGPKPYCFDIAAHIAEGETVFGVYVITVALTEGYRPGRPVDWTARIGDQTGSGELCEGEDLGGTDVASEVAYGLDASASYPVAVFVRLVATSRDDPSITVEETHGPVAVLQLLPDGQGVVRLDL